MTEDILLAVIVPVWITTAKWRPGSMAKNLIKRISSIYQKMVGTDINKAERYV